MDVGGKSFQELNQEFLLETCPQIVLLGIYVFVGIIANTTVILVYVTRMKGHRHQRFFVPFLAVVDLVSGTYNGVGKISLYVMSLKMTSDPLCKAGNILGFILTSFSFWLLFTIALQRYLLICQSRIHFSKRYKLLVMAIGAVISIAFGVPRVRYAGKSEFTVPGTNFTGTKCNLAATGKGSLELRIYTSITVICISVLLVTVIILYCLVLFKIRTVSNRMLRHSVSVTSHSHSESDMKGSYSGNAVDERSMSVRSSSGTLRRNRLESTKSDASIRMRKKRADRNRITYMFALITLTAIVTLVPRIAIERLESTKDESYFFSLSPVSRGFYMFFHGIYIMNNAVNPVIYGLFDATFRKQLKSCLT